jgi:hypothetical protein
MDAKCKLQDCPNPLTGKQIYCTDRCRQITVLQIGGP